MEVKTAEERVVAALEDGPMAEVDLRFQVGMRPEQLSNLLARMVAAGSVQLTGERRRNSRIYRLKPKIIRRPQRHGTKS